MSEEKFYASDVLFGEKDEKGTRLLQLRRVFLASFLLCTYDKRKKTDRKRRALRTTGFLFKSYGLRPLVQKTIEPTVKM